MVKRLDDDPSTQQAWSEIHTIYNEAPIGLAVIDAEFRFKRINATLAEINGVPAEAHIGRTIREVVPALGDFGESIVRQIISTGQAVRNLEVEGETAAQPGVIRTFTEHWSPLKNADGDVVAVNVVVTETTERKAAEQKLLESERRLAAALKAGKLGVFEQTLKPTPHRYWDPLARRIWGLDDVQPISDATFWNSIHPEDLDAVKAFRDSIDTASAPGHFEAEYRILRVRDRAVRWIAVSLDLIFDKDGPQKILGIVQDITNRNLASERDKFLVREVNHRARNLLEVVQVIASQTTRSPLSPEAFAQGFADRLVSLSSSHNLLVQSNWSGVSLYELITTQLAHYKAFIGRRILMTGPQLMISAKSVQDIGMAIHELVTNASKYGALSNEDGYVLIGWNVSVGEDAQFQLSWIELDGPAVIPPNHTGFGTLVTNRMLQSSLQATVVAQYLQSGLQWMLQAPKNYVISN